MLTVDHYRTSPCYPDQDEGKDDYVEDATNFSDITEEENTMSPFSFKVYPTKSSSVTIHTSYRLFRILISGFLSLLIVAMINYYLDSQC